VRRKTSGGQTLPKNIDDVAKVYTTFGQWLKFYQSDADKCLSYVGGFNYWIICLIKLVLSYAYPIACGSALIVAILSVTILGETVTPKIWIGTLLIMAGTVLLALTK